MIDIKLNDGEIGYDVIGEYIRRYWEYNVQDTVICSIGVSYDGIDYTYMNEVADPTGFCDVLFLSDWWEGQKYIRLVGIESVYCLDISGGIYEE